MKLFLNKLAQTITKRLSQSIPENIVSNYAKFNLETGKEEDFYDFIKSSQIKYNKVDSNIEGNNFNVGFFLCDVESIIKILINRNFEFSLKTVSTGDGSIVPKNRITIEYKDDLCEGIKSLIPKKYVVSSVLPHKRFHHIYCQSEDQFDSLFFQNGIQKNVSIERTHFPYIKNMTLKISPNIVNVYFPEELDTEEKASNFFSDLGFNKIVKPSNPKAPWKFYLSNEVDYLKMLTHPYFYMFKCLLILPYYGSPIYLYEGEKKAGNSILIYSKNEIRNIFDSIEKDVPCSEDSFENGHLISCYCQKETRDKLRFLNGAKIDGVRKDYTMIMGDEINQFNLSSPYLKIHLVPNLNLGLIQSLISPFIHKSKIVIYRNQTFLIILPLSFTHYLNLLKLSLETNKCSIPITPHDNLNRCSYVSNCIIVSTRFYEENKGNIEKSPIPLEIITTENGALLFYKSSEIADAMFQLARYDDFTGNVRRFSKSILNSDHCLASNKAVFITGDDFDHLSLNDFDQITPKTSESNENNMMLFFQKIENSFPYLFSNFIEINHKKMLANVLLKDCAENSTLASYLSSESTMTILNFYGIKFIHPSKNLDGYDDLQLKIETIDDLYNVVSMVDDFGIAGNPALIFHPGVEVANL